MIRAHQRRAAGLRRTRGYTLVELMMVVFIIGMMAGMAGLASGASATQHLDMAEVQLRDALAWAQAQARSNRAPVAVVFDAAHDRFALVDEHGAVLSDPVTHAAFIASFHRPNEPRLVDLLDADFGAAGHAAIFDAQGVPLTGGAITLVASGQLRVLHLDAATGALASS